MVVELNAWRLLLAVALVMAIVLSICWAAPERAVPRTDLHRLILTGLGLYSVGGVAALTHHQTLAALVFAAGIFICALAVWLSRGTDSEDPPEGKEPADQPPPPGPDGLPLLDWDDFERAFRAYAARERVETA
ncbi:MAG: hypothetical protein QOJ25_1553 [Solirubrobacteraceae bacterium]|nr:hypothetical protein [Solirubrobacteraceae bacterium]